MNDDDERATIGILVGVVAGIWVWVIVFALLPK